MDKYTKEELLNQTFPCMTVGQLLDFIEKHNIPREAKVLCERVEDVLFEEHGWKTYTKVISGYEESEYHLMWAPAWYRDDANDFLFLDAHY